MSEKIKKKSEQLSRIEKDFIISNCELKNNKYNLWKFNICLSLQILFLIAGWIFYVNSVNKLGTILIGVSIGIGICNIIR